MILDRIVESTKQRVAAEKLEQISEEEFQKLNLRSYRWEDEEYEV